MRIPSGTIDQYCYFFAVDATDFTTPETGLSSFTVYRSRNGGAAAAFATPTINETDATNMAGVYELLLDEDMTIDAGDDEQEMVLHISHAGMAPVVRTITLFRPKATAGETITVSSGKVTVPDTQKVDVHTVKTRAVGDVGDGKTAHLLQSADTGETAVARPGDEMDLVDAPNETAVALLAAPTAEQIWTYTTRVLTANTNLGLPGGWPASWPANWNWSTYAGADTAGTTRLLGLVEDSDGDRFTAKALEQAPSGGTAPTAEQVAQQVRTELNTELGRIDATVSSRSTLTAANIRAAVGLASANLDTQLADIQSAATDEVDVGKVKGVAVSGVADFRATGFLTTLGTNAPAGWINADAIAASALNGKGDWNTIAPDNTGIGNIYAIVNHGTYGNSAIRTRGDAAWTTATGFSTLTTPDIEGIAIETGVTLKQALQRVGAIAAGKVTGAGTGTEVFVGMDGTTTRVTVTVDEDGNRSAITYDA